MAAHGLPPVPLAVNLSPRQFMHRGLIESIRRILDETGIDPALLEFEITETALMQHGEQTLEILARSTRMGIRLSIDDFGTGYSSLAYLKRFPVKKIKIDRAFIKDLEIERRGPGDRGAIIALSDSLQLSVVAEGVETEGQYALLQAAAASTRRATCSRSRCDAERSAESLLSTWAASSRAWRSPARGRTAAPTCAARGRSRTPCSAWPAIPTAGCGRCAGPCSSGSPACGNPTS
jgi:predicted signal transduction protein with EAL and GGDEF domain